MNVVPYTTDNELMWDDFVSECPMHSFLHTRRFLSYHGSKFKDQSLLFFDDKDRLVGIFPAASKFLQDKVVISHPGASFGGALHKGKLSGSKMIDLLQCLIDYYKKNEFVEIIYKAVPYIYHQSPSSDDLYAMFHFNAMLYRRDLSCTVDLLSPLPSSNKEQSKLRNCIRKSEKNGLLIKEGIEYLTNLWEILTTNLKKKYNVEPVHSVDEIKNLVLLFPDNIEVVVAFCGGQIVSGTLLFCNNLVTHTQYLVVTEEGEKIFALDAIIQHCIKKAKNAGYRYFDFGINNEQEGKILNQSLYLSKVKHGGGGVVHDFYKLTLK